MSKRQMKFSVLSKIYSGYTSGRLTTEAAKENIEFLDISLTQAEAEKFLSQFPEITADKFVEFASEMNLLKKRRVAKIGASGNPFRKRLDTPEAALERGVSPENVDRYLTLVGEIKERLYELGDIVTKGTPAFAIPVQKTETETVNE